MAQAVMSAVSAVRVAVPANRSLKARKSAAPRVVTTRAITETVADAPRANSALYDEFKKLLVDYEFSYKVGDRVSGKVFHCDSKGAWVDIGAKAAALCPAAESSLADVRNVSTVHIFLVSWMQVIVMTTGQRCGVETYVDGITTRRFRHVQRSTPASNISARRIDKALPNRLFPQRDVLPYTL